VKQADLGRERELHSFCSQTLIAANAARNAEREFSPRSIRSSQWENSKSSHCVGLDPSYDSTRLVLSTINVLRWRIVDVSSVPEPL
jgi:hypothetical protein